MIFVWIALGLLVAIVALVVLMTRIGKSIPVEHTATSIVRIAAPAAQVFEAIADIATHPTWAAHVTSVEVLPEKDGRDLSECAVGSGGGDHSVGRGGVSYRPDS